MARTTFSGPVRAGTVQDNAGANVGNVVLSQTYDTGNLTGAVVGNVHTQIGTLPANASITAGGRFRGTATAATQLAWQIGTTDTAIWVRNATGTATLTAGRFVVTVSYIQK